MRPPWNPNWDDVTFDHEAAQLVATRSRAVARSIDEGSHALAGAASVAAAAWTGRYREEFDADLRRLQSQRADVAADLRAFADEVERASDDARLEQHRREEQREQWREERRRLEARAAAAKVAAN